MRILALCLVLACTLSVSVEATAEPYRAEPVTDDLEHPVALLPFPGTTDSLAVVQKEGTVVIVKNGSLTGEELLDISSIVNRKLLHGLMGLAFHPEFKANGLFYASFVDVNGDVTVAQFRADPKHPPDENSLTVTIKIAQSFPNQNGSTIAFGPDRLLYVSAGNGGSSSAAAEPNNLFGKVLRINPSDGGGYKVPQDNPMLKESGAEQEIWALGYVSPEGLMFNPSGGELLVLDGRSASGSSVSVARRGASPRDPTVYSQAKLESLVSGLVYRGEQHPNLQGQVILGDNEHEQVFALKPENGAWSRENLISLPRNRISAVGADAQGRLFVATEEGALLEIIPEASDKK